MNARGLIVLALLGLGLLGWYWFRPEKAFLNRRVNEGEIKGRIIAQGEFRGLAHETSGRAAIIESTQGVRMLRLESFATSDGPQVDVYLVAAADAPDEATVLAAGFVSLGPLKGNIGDQIYVLPDGIDLERYHCVSIWCKRFGVNFGVAPLRREL